MSARHIQRVLLARRPLPPGACGGSFSGEAPASASRLPPRMPSLTRRVFPDDFPPFLSLLCSALTLCENDGRRFVGGLSWPGAWPGVGTLQFHLCPRYALAVAPCLRILQLGSHEGISFLGALDFPEHEALGAGPGLSGHPFAGAGILRYLNVKISSLKVSPFTGLASWLPTLSACHALGGVEVRVPFLPPFILGFQLWEAEWVLVRLPQA